MILTRPRPSSMTFAGLRSRCRTPFSCAACRPAQSWRAISTALSDGQVADPLQERREVLAVHVLHREEVAALDLADVVDAADVRVRDLAREAHLGVEAREERLVVRDRLRQELQGDGLAELQVVGAVDLAHPALAEEADDAVALAEHRAGRERAEVERARRDERRTESGFGATAWAPSPARGEVDSEPTRAGRTPDRSGRSPAPRRRSEGSGSRVCESLSHRTAPPEEAPMPDILHRVGIALVGLDRVRGARARRQGLERARGVHAPLLDEVGDVPPEPPRSPREGERDSGAPRRQDPRRGLTSGRALEASGGRVRRALCYPPPLRWKRRKCSLEKTIRVEVGAQKTFHRERPPATALGETNAARTGA